MLADIKKRNIQAEKIKEIAKALEEREIAKKMQLETAKAAEDQDEEAIEELELRRRKLGKIKLPEKELELVLPDELAESLRLLKPEGNALKERYRSLLVRGKVEARARKPFHKQAKRKMTEKWTYKDFNLV
jgi:nucleolar protein 53